MEAQQLVAAIAARFRVPLQRYMSDSMEAYAFLC